MATAKAESGSGAGPDPGPGWEQQPAAPPAGAAEPFFLVGCPRSGTTLLSLMVDCHPRLAVPPESHFVVALAPRRGLGRVLKPATVEDILPYLAARDWPVDHDAVRAAVSRAEPRSYAELVSTVFSTYAAAQGKPRWGDKTPRYVDYVGVLAELFPGARFVHLIRDGREVAASLAERRWGPQSAVLGALIWRRSIRRARSAGRRLGERYMELRLEDLIADPERQLRRVCAFLGEEYAPQMLAYTHRERAMRSANAVGFRHLTKPPTAGLRDWTRGLGAHQQRAVEAVCHGALTELGYPAPPPTRSGMLYAAASLGLRLPGIAAAVLLRYVPGLAGVRRSLARVRRTTRRATRRLRQALPGGVGTPR